MLTDDDKAILDFERNWWKYQGAKEAAILEIFGLSGTRYYQRLFGIVQRPEAHEYDAMTCKRMQRLMRTKQGARSAERLGLG